jgi:hypothetical protein
MKWVLIWVVFQGSAFPQGDNGEVPNEITYFNGQDAQTECALEMAEQDRELKVQADADPTMQYMIFCQDVSPPPMRPVNE